MYLTINKDVGLFRNVIPTDDDNCNILYLSYNCSFMIISFVSKMLRNKNKPTPEFVDSKKNTSGHFFCQQNSTVVG